MSPSIIKPSLVFAAATLAAAALPVAALACKPATAVKAVHKVRPHPVNTVRVRSVLPCGCATRTVVRYVETPPPPPMRRVVVYRTRPEPVFVHAPYVDEPAVYHHYAGDRADFRRDYARQDYYRHDYARRDDYDGRWRHYDWRDE